MIRILLFLLFLSSLAVPLQAQVSEPTAIRIYRIGDQITTADAAGNITGFYPYADVSVKAEGALIRVAIKNVGSLYYTPALFMTEQGTPYGATISAALYLYQLSIPLSASGGGGGTTAATTNAGALTAGTLDEARLPASVVKTTSTITNPTFFTGLDPSRIATSSTAQFITAAEKEAITTAQTKADAAVTAAGSVTATVAAHTTQIGSVSATAATASTNASAALSGATSATGTANNALTTANTALTAANNATATIGTRAPIASPTFSGTVTIPAIPSLAVNDSTKKPAPSDFVKQNIQAAIDIAVARAVKRATDTLKTYGSGLDSTQFVLRYNVVGQDTLSSFGHIKESVLGSGGSGSTDASLSTTSTNAVSNAAVTAGLNTIIGATLTPSISGFSATPTTGGLTLNWITTQKGVTTNDLGGKADAGTVSALSITVAGNTTAIAGKLDKASNLSDIASAATARANLGLGSMATLPAPAGTVVGTTDPQTLTNKALSGASNTFSNISADALIDGTTNKVYTGTEKTKLAGIATGATANSTDATLLNRANHTGTMPTSALSGVVPVSQIGTGTPAAGKYVDGATGAWTTLPTATVPLVYYISPTGSDSNDGKTPATAWATTAKIVALTPFVPGTTFRFQGGATFTANLELYQAQSGTAAAPVIFESYGGGKAILQADGSVANSFGLYMENVSYLTFQNLVLKGVNNVTSDGIYIGNGAGNNTLLQGLKFLNCEVYGFTKGTGFYSFFVGATCGFKNMVVEGCSFHDNLNGFLIAGNERAINSPNINDGLIVRRCIAYNNRGSLTVTTHTGSGFIMGFVTNGLIELCEAYGNGSQNGSSSGGPYGIWMYECINSTIQYCESHHNFTKTSNNDGGGFDIDGGCQGCIIQYCYSHDNEGPGFVIVQFTGAVSNQTNNTIRYNISQNDVRANLQGSLMVYNVTHAGNKLHNNVIYVGTKGAKSGTPYVILTGGASTSSTSIQNNIFIADGSTVTMKFGTTSEVYSNNYYYFLNSGVNNFSTGGTVGNPLLQSPGTARTVGVYSTGTLQGYLDEYKLMTGSPAINSGATMATPTLDFYANTAPIGTRDIGVHEYQ